MMRALWCDEAGYVMSAELVLLGTVVTIGSVVGMKAVSHATNGELTDVAFALRSLDQSFEIEGASNCEAATAGSHFKQMPVIEAHAELREVIEVEEAKAEKRMQELEKHQEKMLQQLKQEAQLKQRQLEMQQEQLREELEEKREAQRDAADKRELEKKKNAEKRKAAEKKREEARKKRKERAEERKKKKNSKK